MLLLLMQVLVMQDSLIECPFVILVDSAEGQPFTFKKIRADANQKRATFVTRTHRTNLGRHPTSYGDYSLEGGFGECAVERKSMEDCWGTLLGWPTGWEQDRDLPGRRERFEVELGNLNAICSLIVVEASLAKCVAEIPQWGVKPAEENAKIFFRTVISYQQRFPHVQWAFCDSRRMAEIYCFRWLYRYWSKNLKPKGRKRGQMGVERGQDGCKWTLGGDLTGVGDWL